jgi:hypothetical protein
MVEHVLVPVTTDTGPNVRGPDVAGDGDSDVAPDGAGEGGAGDGDEDGDAERRATRRRSSRPVGT